MVEAFEKKFWRRSFEVLFPQLVCHKWGASDLLWVSVKHLPGTLDDEGKPVTEGGRPDHNNIVVTSDVSRTRKCQFASRIYMTSCITEQPKTSTMQRNKR